ncbi:unnamed protein product [Pedinophyceae sp. YPF-701]|nr:unnamed protein product [Pedinophyceae sp. YPF-701]
MASPAKPQPPLKEPTLPTKKEEGSGSADEDPTPKYFAVKRTKKSLLMQRKSLQDEEPALKLDGVVVLAGVLGLLFFLMWFTWYLLPRGWAMPWYRVAMWTVLFFPAGVYAKWYQTKHNIKKKEHSNALQLRPGRGFCLALLGEAPSWVKLTSEERPEWLNSAVKQLWPFYDKAIAQQIKEQVEPLLEEYRPSSVRRIYFARLTFGGAPFRFETARVSSRTDKEVCLDMRMTWAGDTDIQLNIETPIKKITKNADGEKQYATMVVKIQDISLNASVKVILTPFVPIIPCFGAALVSMSEAPVIKFRLAFTGGAMFQGMITDFLDSFIKDTLATMMVWPQRIVVPVLAAEDIPGGLDQFTLSVRGVLKVRLIEARGLGGGLSFDDDDEEFGERARGSDTETVEQSAPSRGLFGRLKEKTKSGASQLASGASQLKSVVAKGTMRPHVEMYVRSLRKVTSTTKDGSAPKWNETYHFLVQEPESESLRLTCAVSTMSGREKFVGRGMLHIRHLRDEASLQWTTKKLWVDLGEQEWRDGCGRGRGQLLVEALYIPKDESRKPTNIRLDQQRGALLATVRSVKDLPKMDLTGWCDPYCVLQIGSDKATRRKTSVKKKCKEATFDEKFEWFDMVASSTLTLEVLDKDKLDVDDTVGQVDIPLELVATAPGFKLSKTFSLQCKKADTTVSVDFEWLPFAA